MSGLQKYKDESAIIGRLLTGYTDLEIDLLHCVQVATGDFDAAFKGMFAKRGETVRINSALALGRQTYVTLGLDTDFDKAVDAMRYCLLIRNHYAHHNFWDDYSGQLAIGDFETVAKQPVKHNDLRGVKPRHLNVALLLEQERYFRFADSLLAWVNHEGRFMRGILTNNPVIKPTEPPRPNFDIP